MVRTTALLAATAALALHAQAEGIYGKTSGVLQITGMDYDRVIAKSNYTSIVEFYAPWCGHCKNLKPAYETAAKSLAGIAKVAAVNCDEEINKPFCGQMGVQGFPTLKIVRPSKKPGKPKVEDYQGARSAKGIVDAVKDKVPNIVKRLNDKSLAGWLQENKDSAKAILFSDKGVVSATIRALAIDFAGLVSVAQVKKSEKAAVEKYGITEFPSLILIPAGSDDSIKHEGKVDKAAMVDFLSQVAPPNPDCPAPKEKRSKAKRDDKKVSKSSSKFAKASASHKSADASSAAATATDETVEEPIVPTKSPSPNVKDEDTPKPIVIPAEDIKPTIPLIAESAELQSLCLNEKSKTCILAILPKDESSEAAKTAVASLASIHKKYDAAGARLFPFVGVTASNPVAASLLTTLGLGSDEQVHLIATHGKRAWYKKYPSTAFSAEEIEKWVDSIRMDEGKKEKLPNSILVAGEKPDATAEKVAEPEPVKIEVEEVPDEPETQPEHNEL
ncbi:protein disulfide-isomerase MPD1 precursor [Cucurbitaria berberidis CBS 394.84]|uniref:protein disulfide-isomerase n=1 Tax=Cucurbitaria berberidis CBS 394.84 TaxID=1168544 RepID=A0A9P4L382_9PLEO|nr:protein disulfide-isomerase MPD1 precursor [Cucurbitaria berberidis CBS 394.84]KAF1839989.1 protein disulfide-isomerase MPD1 precursor [Cucurbitaria berberidis CBS 394.84]